MPPRKNVVDGLEFKPCRAKYGGFPDFALLYQGKVIAHIDWINGPPYLSCHFVGSDVAKNLQEGVERVASMTKKQIENA